MLYHTKKYIFAALTIFLVSHINAEPAATVGLAAWLKASAVALKSSAVAACQAHPVVAGTTIVVTLGIVGFKCWNRPQPLCTNIADLQCFSFVPVDKAPEGAHYIKYTDIEASIKAKKYEKQTPIDGAYIDMQDRTLKVLKQLPEGETRPIVVRFVPLVCCSDTRTHDRGVYEAHETQNKEVVHDTVTVSYALPTYDHRQFDFGGKGSQELFSNLLNKIAKNNPNAPIIVDGVCASATGIVNTLANPELAQEAKPNIVGANLESPAISSDDVWQQMGHSYLPWPIKGIFPLAARQYFPSCPSTPKNEAVLATYDNIPPHIQVHIARNKSDPVTSSASIDAIVQKLRSNGNSVEIHEDSNPKFEHGAMVTDPEFRKRSAAFCKRVTNSVATKVKVCTPSPQICP